MLRGCPNTPARLVESSSRHGNSIAAARGGHGRSTCIEDLEVVIRSLDIPPLGGSGTRRVRHRASDIRSTGAENPMVFECVRYKLSAAACKPRSCLTTLRGSRVLPSMMTGLGRVSKPPDRQERGPGSAVRCEAARSRHGGGCRNK